VEFNKNKFIYMYILFKGREVLRMTPDKKPQKETIVWAIQVLE